MVQATQTQVKLVMPNPVSAQLEPYELGMMDALDGEYCLPELYFANATAKALYTLGYESVRMTDLSRHSWKRWGGAL